MLKRIPLALIVVLAVAVSGCSAVTGPSRMFRVLGPDSVTDFSTFEGTVVSPCSDVRTVVGDSEIVIGCLLEVAVIGKAASRRVFVPAGELYTSARQIPRHARVSVNGEPYGEELAFLAKALKWKSE